MRIATWNVNGLRARLDFVAHWLRARQPDVVGLQELKLTDGQFPHEALAELGYRALTHGQKSWNGVAVLAREGLDLETVQAGLPGQEALGARLLSARVGELHFTTVYTPNGKTIEHADFPRKLAWLEDLAAHLAPVAAGDVPAVLCGDFNVCPAPIDSWDEERLAGAIFHTDDERKRFGALLEAGWVDLFRQLYPDVRAFSWWDYRGGAFHRRQGLRIDFLLGNAALAGRLREVEIDREYRKKQDGMTASDHAPVIADLES